MTPKRQGWMAVVLFVLLIAIDQIIKIYIKTHFCLRQSVEVTSWFYLSFIENNGMAYGMEFVPKYALTAFRIILTCGFGWLLYRCIQRRLVSTSFVVVVTMVLAGAMGNVIDCVFYGQWFTDSYGHVAQWADPSAGLLPAGEWFKGRVVDMLYFPLVRFDWPSSFPTTQGWIEMCDFLPHWLIGWLPSSDEPFMFFKPVFNFADACISVGVVLLVLFFRKDFSRLEEAWSEDKKNTPEHK